jgi:phosphate transport system substrate-binding protein
MKSKIVFSVVVSFLIIVALMTYSCDKNAKDKNKQTILKGKVNVLVDQTILPVIEDQKEVFENQYNAEVSLIGKSESEIVQLLSKDKYRLAILSRELTKDEAEIFEKKNIQPRVTPLATDAIAFVANQSNKDMQINVQDIIAFLQGKEQGNFEGLVFDNPNSSTVRYMKEIAKVNELPKRKIFSFQTNNEVIKFVSKNKGMIGIVGVNWLLQPQPEMITVVSNITVLAVKSTKLNIYVKPNQENVATGDYPLTREIKMINYQGFSGLGMGFASFIAGDIGQRIILKSGLMPIRLPSRNIIIRKGIEKKK